MYYSIQDFIKNGIADLLLMLHEFQHGKTISLYHEKQNTKKADQTNPISQNSVIPYLNIHYIKGNPLNAVFSHH